MAYVSVSGHYVGLYHNPVTGRYIKEEAVRVGALRKDAVWQLQMQMPNGSNKVVGDADEVDIIFHSEFDAVDIYDNA